MIIVPSSRSVMTLSLCIKCVQIRRAVPSSLTCDLLPGVDTTEADLSVVLHPAAEVLLKHSRLGVLHHPLHLQPGQVRSGQIRSDQARSG